MSNVLNRFKQPGSDSDNAAIFDGTFETSTGQSLKKVIVQGRLPDISSVSSPDNLVFLAAPFSGTVTKITVALQAAIATADAVIITGIGGIAITDGVITVPNGSIPGHIVSVVPTALNQVVAGQFLSALSDGGSTNTAAVTITFEIEPS